MTGADLRRLRTEAGVSLAQLAAERGVSKQAVADVESGTRTDAATGGAVWANLGALRNILVRQTQVLVEVERQLTAQAKEVQAMKETSWNRETDRITVDIWTDKNTGYIHLTSPNDPRFHAYLNPRVQRSQFRQFLGLLERNRQRVAAGA